MSDPLWSNQDQLYRLEQPCNVQARRDSINIAQYHGTPDNVLWAVGNCEHRDSLFSISRLGHSCAYRPGRKVLSFKGKRSWLLQSIRMPGGSTTVPYHDPIRKDKEYANSQVADSHTCRGKTASQQPRKQAHQDSVHYGQPKKWLSLVCT